MSRNYQDDQGEATLLRLLDGDLNEWEAAELRSHLNGCWQCRRDLGEWQGTIDAFLRMRETASAADPPPPKPWLPIDQLLYPGKTEPAPKRWWKLRKLAAVTAAEIAPAAKEGRTPDGRAGEANPAAARHSQVLAAQALHELGADLGEPVTVIPSSTGATVRADGLEERRRREIEAALAKLPGVVFEARTVKPAAGTASAPAGRPKLYEERLLRRLGSAAAVEAFANAILDDSDAVTARAHAIERLERLFPRRGVLSAADGRIVAGMLVAHRTALHIYTESLRTRLGPMPAGRPGSGAQLAARASELDRLLNVAFAGARMAVSDDELAGRIQTLLEGLE